MNANEPTTEYNQWGLPLDEIEQLGQDLFLFFERFGSFFLSEQNAPCQQVRLSLSEWLATHECESEYGRNRAKNRNISTKHAAFHEQFALVGTGHHRRNAR